MYAIGIGIVTTLLILIVLSRMDIRKFMGYPATLDITVTVAMAWLLHGSVTGLVAAAIGGLLFSVLITGVRNVYGYKTLTRKGWVYHQGKWATFAIDKYKECKEYSHG